MFRSRLPSQLARCTKLPAASTSKLISTSPEASANTPVVQIASSAHTVSNSSNKYFKITLLRSAISLGSRKKGTLESLGIHRRMQTVYHKHTPECAGKILAVKELLRVENVGAETVRTKTEQRRERRAPRGFSVVGGLNDGVIE